TEHATSLPLASLVLRGLLEANKSGRAKFFEHIDEWFVLLALEPLLPGLSLDAPEAAVLCRRIDTFTARDSARGDAIEALVRWATHHPSVARSIVDAWFAQESWAAGLDLSSI